MIFFNAVSLSPICFRIFNIDIYWYGVAYVLSIVGALFCAKRLTMASENFDVFVPWACIGIVVGGRLGHVIFFDYHYYSAHLLDIFKIRDGGMSFHGGLCGIIISAWLFCKKRSIDFLSFLDVLAMVAPIGLFFGRIANFINGELYGLPTKLSCGVYFRGLTEPRHPTQLYEAFTEGFITFFVLKFYGKLKSKKKLHSDGIITCIFAFCYAISRFFIDFLKDTDRYLQLTIGQWLSIVMIIIWTGLYVFLRKKFNVHNKT
jgi:phosphatidylglycerol:prolipoprotein diacylglycerol transferase